jgi:primosomal protein N'
LQTSKSIEELEAILEKRWGTATSKKSDDGDFVMSFEEETEEPSRFHAHSEEKPRGAAVLRSRRVRDPWEKDDEEPARGEDSKNRWFNRDDAMLKRVRSNQQRINNKKVKSQPRDDDETYQISIKNKDYYDQDDEGYETEGSIISPRPAGGRGKSAALDGGKSGRKSAALDGGKSAALDGGIFSVRADNKRVKPMKEPATTVKEKEDKKRPKRKEPQLQPMLDEDGKPMFLTLEQAERIVENILSSNPEGSNSLDSTGDVEWQDIGITNPQLLSNLQSSEMMCPLPLEVQIKACPPIIAGNDVLVSTHTGSGKTLAFLAPLAQNIMVNPSNSPLPKALIVAPGRELASQIVSVAQQLFRGTDLTVAMVIGGTAYMRNVEMLRSKKPDVVVGTPGRIAELIMGRSGDK